MSFRSIPWNGSRVQARSSLLPNERYWGPRPPFARVVYREILDDTARLTTFRNGDVDRYIPTPEQYVALKDDPAILDPGESIRIRDHHRRLPVRGVEPAPRRRPHALRR